MTSLFDSLDTWKTDPAKAFDAFVTSNDFLDLSMRKPAKRSDGKDLAIAAPLRHSSVRVYRAMFGKYLRWLGEYQLYLFDVTSADLMRFLDQRTQGAGSTDSVLTSRIRYKYLKLIERTYRHLHVEPNPARHACFEIFKGGDQSKAGKDESMATLSDAQQTAFLNGLPTSSTNNWKTLRDRAMQSLMIGAGLKVSEVIGIRVENVGEKDATGSVPVTISPGSAGGTVRWHQTQLRPFAVPEVLAWLRERRERDIPGPLLFPASLQGGRLNPATLYRQVKATFARAEIAVPRKGGRTLRNSFAVRELAAGADIELVGEFLGHRRRRSTEYYVAAGAASEPKDVDPSRDQN